MVYLEEKLNNTKVYHSRKAKWETVADLKGGVDISKMMEKLYGSKK